MKEGVTTTPIKYYENEMKPNVISLPTTLRKLSSTTNTDLFSAKKRILISPCDRKTTCNYPQWGYKYFRQIFAETEGKKEKRKEGREQNSNNV